MIESSWIHIGDVAMSAVLEVAAERLPAQPESAATPMRLMELAIDKGASLEQLERLMALQERWEANEARKAFVKAMAAFKSEPILVTKDGEVDFTNKAGQRTYYRHATLANVVDAVVSRMGKFGLSHKWEAKQTEGAVSVTCVITHELGHSESVTLAGPRDDSGNKNALQQVASSMTYLQRYTLMSLCGLASREMDDDGEQSGQRQGSEENTGINPRGELGKNQEPKKVGEWAAQFLKAMQADKEEADIAADVYKLHLQVCNDADLYTAIAGMLASNYKNAIRKYVDIHKKAKGL